MDRLYLPPRLFARDSSSSLVAERAMTTCILVGQRVAVMSCTAYVVLVAVPCPDTDVIAEQVECMAQVLPPGLTALGVALVGEEVDTHVLYDLASRLREHCTFDSLVALYGSPRADCAAVHRLRARRLGTLDTSPELALVREECTFYELPCRIHAQPSLLPLLIYSREGSAESRLRETGDVTWIDLLDEQPLSAHAQAVVRKGAAVQLGLVGESNAPCPMPQTSLTICPAHLCGKDMLDVLSVLYTSRLWCDAVVRVRSRRHAPLIYCIRRTAPHDVAVWSSIQELIEDATGEVVDRAQVIGDALDSDAAKQRPDAVMQGRTRTRYVRYILPAALLAMILVIVLVFLPPPPHS